MNLKQKAIIGMVASFFAVATVFNMSMLNENNAGDVSLDAIMVMTEAEAEVADNPCPGGGNIWRCHYVGGRCATAIACRPVCYGGC
jgi:hypothetical protein